MCRAVKQGRNSARLARTIQDVGCELPRIRLLRTRVHRGKAAVALGAQIAFSNACYNTGQAVVPLVGVRSDAEEDRQLASSPGVVARPEFVARAGDRRLLTGAASPVRIFLLSGVQR